MLKASPYIDGRARDIVDASLITKNVTNASVTPPGGVRIRQIENLMRPTFNSAAR